MPSKSKAQEKLMRAAAHNKEFSDKAGIPQDVAKEFHEADKKVKANQPPPKKENERNKMKTFIKGSLK